MTDQNDELRQALRLQLVPGIGPRLTQVLLERFGSHGAVFAASKAELSGVDGIGPKLVASIHDRGVLDDVEDELRRCDEHDVDILPIASEAYPTSLKQIPDPPQLMYVKGTLEPGETCVAIVGSRNCTHYGLAQAEKFAYGLAQAGVTVVSGLARGIDAAAHRGALKAGGRTLAVCAPGLGTIYPPEHATLAEQVTGSGALLSESPIMRAPNRGLFPQRNRVISGLSLGVLIVEASRTSGSLHTAKHAIEQNREVFAIPGRIDVKESEGCLDLIRDGAALVRNVDDVLDVVQHLAARRGRGEEPIAQPRTRSLFEKKAEPVAPVTAKVLPKMSEAEQTLFALLDSTPLHIDELISRSRLDSGQALASLTMLEMKRAVKRLPGNQLIRNG